MESQKLWTTLLLSRTRTMKKVTCYSYNCTEVNPPVVFIERDNHDTFYYACEAHWLSLTKILQNKVRYIALEIVE